MASYSDDFNRADGALGSDYDTVTGTTTLRVSSNECDGSTDPCRNTVKTSIATFANDHEAEVDFAAVGSNDFAGPMVRGDSSNDDGYYVHADGLNFGERRVYRVDAGTPTNIGSVNVVPSATDNVRLRAEGTTIEVFLNDSSVDSITDSTHSSGQPGLHYARQSTDTTHMDNFLAADLSTASTSQLTFANQSSMYGIGRVSGRG